MTDTSPAIIGHSADSLVIIPTYNEKENIEAIIAAVFDLPQIFDILIIDDNSPDGTAGIVRDMMTKYQGRLHMIERKGKLGLGTAYITGFKWAIEHGYEYICEMDADFSHAPTDLPKLRQACVDGADVAIGSRYLTGVNVVNWPMGRVLMSYYASVYVLHGRIRVLPQQGATRAPSRQDTFQRLRIPDRDEISGTQVRLQDN